MRLSWLAVPLFAFAAVSEVVHPGLSGYGQWMLEEWRAPECVSDDLQNTVFGMAVDLADTDQNGTPDQVHVYAAVSRVGIEVLRFDPGLPAGQRLAQIDHIELPYGEAGIKIRDHLGQRTLLVSDSKSGLRILVYRY